MNPRRIVAPAIVLVLLAAVAVGFAAPAQADTLFGGTLPRNRTDPDAAAVELGVRFSSDTGGVVTGVRFYRGAANKGPHTGTLWDDTGRKLATTRFKAGQQAGWTAASFSTPVRVRAGQTYVASYTAPAGRYAGDNHGFDQPYRRGHLTVPAGGGVYAYGGGFPRSTWQNTNYYVDVSFRADPGPPAPTPTSSASPPTGSASPTPSPPTSIPPNTPLAQLPRVPWEGADYWRQFRKADKAGWDNPSFFPIGVWWSVAGNAGEVAHDRGLGLNTYVLTNPQADYRLIEKGGMFWVGGPLPGSSPTSPNWVGSFLDDEVDGRYEPAEGYRLLQRLSDANSPATTGRFRYANHTSGIVTYDRPASVTNPYVNRYTDAVSLDQYFYSVPQCDWEANALRWRTPRGGSAIVPANCRTSSSYGKMIDLLRESDATDGKLQSIWQFVEVVGDHRRLDGNKVQGAAMNSVIHEARGLMWFPQSFSGGCETGNAFRTYQVSKPACLRSQVEGVKKVNRLLTSLAPVLNTQSYRWSFGPGIDSMLKVHGGSAYVFAMPRDGGRGSRTFTLPVGVAGRTVEVVGENRRLPVRDRVFVDTFARESSYHVYKVSVR